MKSTREYQKHSTVANEADINKRENAQTAEALMRNAMIIASGGLVLALGACGGGDGGGQVEVSSGIFEVELPTGADFDNLPAEAQALINEFKERNEGELGTTPAGTATYTGTAGIAVDDVDETLLIGAINLNADFGANTIGGAVSDVTIYSGGNTLTPDDPADAIEIGSGTITDSRYTATLDGDLTITGEEGAETYLLTSDVNGAFVGTDATGTIGLFENGTVTAPDMSTDQFSGIFSADKN